MRCRIRYITRKGLDGRVQQDHEANVARLRIGRGAECEVFLSDLRVALDHAVLAPSEGDSFILHARAASGVRIEQEVRTVAEVAVGSHFSIGSFELALVQPDPGFDLQLEVEQTQATRGKELEAGLKERSVLRLADTGLKRRVGSWALFLGVLLLFGILPMTGFFLPGLGQILRDGPLPGDGAWEPGPLAPAHQYFGADCNACHQRAFVQVEDSACVTCHQRMPHHLDPDFHASLSLTATRCASCHQDHSENGSLVRHDDAYCADCHADLKALDPSTTLADVAGFGAEHPEFRFSLLRVIDGSTLVERLSPDSPEGFEESSNLRFAHAEHLNADGVDTVAGVTRVLNCIDCHVPEAGGIGMAPVSFELHCHECHSLGFEADDPGRELPHGRPAAILDALEEYYANRALIGGYPSMSAPAVVRRARRPGVELTPAERLAALEWVRQTSQEIAGEVLEFRVCASCHEVTRETLDTPATRPSWRVTPVRIADQWLPKARFDHGQHRISACEDCHDARESILSEDVLVPGISNCRGCHGGAGATDRVASSCVDCHGFHVSEQFFMGQARE